MIEGPCLVYITSKTIWGQRPIHWTVCPDRSGPDYLLPLFSYNHHSIEPVLIKYKISFSFSAPEFLKTIQELPRVKKGIHEKKSRIKNLHQELASCHLLMQAAYKKLLHELHPTLLRDLSWKVYLFHGLSAECHMPWSVNSPPLRFALATCKHNNYAFSST